MKNFMTTLTFYSANMELRWKQNFNALILKLFYTCVEICILASQFNFVSFCGYAKKD